MITVALIFFPLVAAFVMLFIKRQQAELTAFYLALAELGLFGYAATQLSSNPTALSLDVNWLPFGAHFAVSMDGISFLMVLLTTLLMPLIITASSSGYYSNRFYALVFLMQMALVGVFTAMDGFLFYIFWELALIPIYFICLMWGGEHRGRITFKFFVYTLAGSLVMLAGLLFVYLQTPGDHSFLIKDLYTAGQNMSDEQQGWVFWAIFIAFAIKMPVFPFHTWQPDTYVTAPTAGTMLLSGIMLKMGTYGLLRWLMPLVPMGWKMWGNTAMILAIIGIVYASLIAISQKDYKRLIAYSSIAHVGLIAAGLLTMRTEGITGGLIQMVAHGINVVGLFFVAEILMERTKTHDITAMGGIRGVAPKFALLFLITLLGSVALPLTNGFVGEFLLINGIYQHNFWMAAVAGLTVILGAVYMLRSYQSVMLGETKQLTEGFKDLDTNETTVLLTVSVLVIVLGVFPKPLLDIVAPAVEELLQVFQSGLIK
ncbi:MAG: NADH-quinone oxidoreductase subunit M [Saprospiraceae bacterium]|nr:NADH-quinone oxidoreductase subunit M [Saprospiraceae bacterium]